MTGKYAKQRLVPVHTTTLQALMDYQQLRATVACNTGSLLIGEHGGALNTGLARDFSRWLTVAGKPARPHWRHREDAGGGVVVASPAAQAYAVSVRAHSETVLRGFYDFRRDAGFGPALNPFPLARSTGARVRAHRNPMEANRDERVGAYRPRVAVRIPRAVPDVGVQ